MTQLVDNDVVDQFGWYLNEMPIVVEILEGSTGCPNCFLFFDGDTIIGDANAFCPFGTFFFQVGSCRHAIVGDDGIFDFFGRGRGRMC